MWEYYKLHSGKILGVLAGLLFGFIYLKFGFIDTVVVFLLVFLGFYLGSKKDQKEDLKNILKNVLPDNFFDRDHH